MYTPCHLLLAGSLLFVVGYQIFIFVPQTLHDTLDFDIKVDFNAGVVAAGEAQIESTVTGNVGEAPASVEQGLVSQSQVFLPINNALSKVGHAHRLRSSLSLSGTRRI
jgi:hypothetical protein